MTDPVDVAASLLGGRRVVVLSGAGLSTDSGIPDYRGPTSVARAPMTYQDFVSGPVAQQRYWARSFVGWRTMQHARPNAGHVSVAELEAAGVVLATITQNVDGLHQAAGARAVIDLHGRLSQVVCLRCGERSSRRALDERLGEANPYFAADSDQIAPDGDAELTDVSGFHLVGCVVCGGPLKPDVVFFGENVPRERVERCYALVDSAQALLVLGSSLTVQSGLRFVRRARSLEIPVVIVNRGATRGDPLADLRIDAGCSQTLQALQPRLEALVAGPAQPANR